MHLFVHSYTQGNIVKIPMILRQNSKDTHGFEAHLQLNPPEMPGHGNLVDRVWNLECHPLGQKFKCWE